MSIQENTGALRPTNPHIQMLTPETARALQEHDFTRPSGYTVEFAEIVSRIAEYDGHLTAAEMERGLW